MSIGLIILSSISFVLALVFIYLFRRLNFRLNHLNEFYKEVLEDDEMVEEKIEGLKNGIDIARSGNMREIQSLIENLVYLRDGAATLHNSSEIMGDSVPEELAKVNLMELVSKTQERILVLEEYHFYEYGRHHTLPYHLTKFRNYMDMGSSN